MTNRFHRKSSPNPQSFSCRKNRDAFGEDESTVDVDPCVGLSADDFSHHAIAYKPWQVEGGDLADFFGRRGALAIRSGR
jgi:hypothetical protein